MDVTKSKSPQSFLRRLRDANRDDKDLLGICNGGQMPKIKRTGGFMVPMLAARETKRI